MQLRLVLNTVMHLKPQQIYHQVVARVHQPQFQFLEAPDIKTPPVLIAPIPKPICYNGYDEFNFINIIGPFKGWGNKDHGNLWAFNQNYMDWLNQGGVTDEDAEKWVDKYITDMPDNVIGNDPYVTALRCMNWFWLFATRPQLRNKRREDALYSQCKLLEKKLEYKLLANHLLEELFALFIASIYFRDQHWYELSNKGLRKELDEQILKDGAHYELSPMYQTILLDRLLDCYNFCSNNPLFSGQKEFADFMASKAMLMLGHLMTITYKDDSIPLLNDAARGIGPACTDLFDYAKRLSLKWDVIPLTRCGYRKLNNKRIEAVVDISQIRATYQPGHTHADFFTYELRIDGEPFIVDTGTSTYDKGRRRDYERSTKAHNTVTVEGKDSCEVWSGFRVGKRPRIHIVTDFKDEVMAWHQGFGKGLKHTRHFVINPSYFGVSDEVSKSRESISYIHFAEGVEPHVSDDLSAILTTKATISINGAQKIDILENTYSEEYNITKNCKVAAIHFDKKMEYKVQLI